MLAIYCLLISAAGVNPNFVLSRLVLLPLCLLLFPLSEFTLPSLVLPPLDINYLAIHSDLTPLAFNLELNFNGNYVLPSDLCPWCQP